MKISQELRMTHGYENDSLGRWRFEGTQEIWISGCVALRYVEIVSSHEIEWAVLRNDRRNNRLSSWAIMQPLAVIHESALHWAARRGIFCRCFS